MAGSITFVGTYAVPEGRFDEWVEANTEMVDFVKANVPRLISYDVYVNEAKTEATTIYVHPDAESFEEHMKVAATRIDRGAQMVDVLHIEVYGHPGQRVVERLHQVSEASNGFPVAVKQHFYG
ncbi:MAG: hypothetical protein V1912_03320 [bacterium]